MKNLESPIILLKISQKLVDNQTQIANISRPFNCRMFNEVQSLVPIIDQFT